MSKPHRLPDSGNAIGLLATELGSTPLLKGLQPLDDGSVAEHVHGDDGALAVTVFAGFDGEADAIG
ncbi:MAG: hypothetical protein E5W75_01250, partial [Mesorhizobium sp.]